MPSRRPRWGVDGYMKCIMTAFRLCFGNTIPARPNWSLIQIALRCILSTLVVFQLYNTTKGYKFWSCPVPCAFREWSLK